MTLTNCDLELTDVDMAGNLTVTGSILTADASAKDIDGDVDWSDAGNDISCGSGTVWTFGADFDFSAIGTITKETATFMLTGSGPNVLAGRGIATAQRVHSLTLDTGSSYQVTGSIGTHSGLLLVKSGASVDIATGKYLLGGPGETQIQSGATISKAGTGLFWLSSANLTQQDGEISAKCLIQANSSLVGGNYSGLLIFQETAASNRTMILTGAFTVGSLEFETTSSGNITIDCTGLTGMTVAGDLTIDMNGGGGDITINNTGNSAAWEFQGDVINEQDGDTFLWTKGNGTITASESNPQDWDLLGQAVEDIEVDKTNKTDVLTFSGSVTTDSLTVTKGTIDPNGQTITTTDMTMTANSQFDPAVDAMDGCEFVISNDLDFDGSDGDPLIMKWQVAFTFDVANDCNLNWVTFTPSDPGGGKVDMLLEVSGSAVATNCVVEHSDASSYTLVEATTSTNSGNNTNWAFAVPKSVTGSLEFTATSTQPKTMTESKASSLELAGAGTYNIDAIRSEASSLALAQTGIYNAEYLRSEASSLELAGAGTYIAEYLREESASLVVADTDAYNIEAIRSESGALIFTQVVVYARIGELIFTHSVVYALEAIRTESSSLILADSIDVSFTPAPTLCELREHWPRWIFASVSKYFSEIAASSDLHYFIEGTHRITKEHKKFIEFRMDGPNITEVSKNYFQIDVEINMLWSFNQDHENFHESQRITGILLAAMTDICIYRYGDEFVDNDELLGTLSLRQDKKNPIRVNNFGQIRPDVKLMQGTVEGTFRMTLTCGG